MMKNSDQTAIVLLSGGLDSATTLAIAANQGFAPIAITFNYHQRHQIEIAAAERIAEQVGVVEHVIIPIDRGVFAGSALTGDIDVPKERSAEEMTSGIPITYVPARNTIFLSYALAIAEVKGAADIFIGVNAIDYSGYPDCRPEFIRAYQDMANLATKAGVTGGKLTIRTPLITLSKAEIIAAGARLNVDFGRTVSCYDPSSTGHACGRCDSCILRRKGFSEAGVPDPTRYI